MQIYPRIYQKFPINFEKFVNFQKRKLSSAELNRPREFKEETSDPVIKMEPKTVNPKLVNILHSKFEKRTLLNADSSVENSNQEVNTEIKVELNKKEEDLHDKNIKPVPTGRKIRTCNVEPSLIRILYEKPEKRTADKVETNKVNRGLGSILEEGEIPRFSPPIVNKLQMLTDVDMVEIKNEPIMDEIGNLTVKSYCEELEPGEILTESLQPLMNITKEEVMIESEHDPVLLDKAPLLVTTSNRPRHVQQTLNRRSCKFRQDLNKLCPCPHCLKGFRIENLRNHFNEAHWCPAMTVKTCQLCKERVKVTELYFHSMSSECKAKWKRCNCKIKFDDWFTLQNHLKEMHSDEDVDELRKNQKPELSNTPSLPIEKPCNSNSDGYTSTRPEPPGIDCPLCSVRRITNIHRHLTKYHLKESKKPDESHTCIYCEKLIKFKDLLAHVSSGACLYRRVCYFCKVKLKNWQSLKAHLLEDHNVHCCNDCNAVCGSKFTFEAHVKSNFHLYNVSKGEKTEKGTPQNACPLCPIGTSVRNLKLHLRVVHGGVMSRPDVTIQCKICKENVKTKDLLDHSATCLETDEIGRHFCETCKVTFTVHNVFKQHSTLHEETNSNKIGRNAPSKTDDKTMVVLNGVLLNVSKVQATKNSKATKEPVKTILDPLEIENYPCPVCKKSVKINELNSHLNMVHPKEDKKYHNCFICKSRVRHNGIYLHITGGYYCRKQAELQRKLKLNK